VANLRSCHRAGLKTFSGTHGKYSCGGVCNKF
jgi:hypothetical protein